MKKLIIRILSSCIGLFLLFLSIVLFLGKHPVSFSDWITILGNLLLALVFLVYGFLGKSLIR